MKNAILLVMICLIAVSTLAMFPNIAGLTDLEFQFKPLIESPADDMYPYILQDSTNKIWVFFVSDRTDGGHDHVFYITSVDGGITWSSVSLFLPAFMSGRDVRENPVAFQDSTGKIWVAWLNHTAPYNADQVWFTTSDDGEIWDPAKRLCGGHNDIGGFTEAYGKIWFFFSPLSSYWSLSYKTTEDGGDSWSDLVPITESGMRTPHPTVLTNGTIFVVYRVGAYHTEANIGYSASSDGGLTWKCGLVDDPVYPEWDGEPTVTEFNGAVYVFFLRVYDPATNDVWFRVWNKTKWENPQQLTHGLVHDHPCAMCINNQLWLVFQKHNAGVWDIWVARTDLYPIAFVDIDPDTLNLKSEGNWITVYIGLPDGYNVKDIDVSSILLNDTVAAEAQPTCIGDHDSDGVPDLMVKFSRDAVIQYLRCNLGFLTPERIKPLIYRVNLTVTGSLIDGTAFEGVDTIRTIQYLKGYPEPD